MSSQLNQNTPRRNDPCPCGSGKRYKQCCGALGTSATSASSSSTSSPISSSSDMDTGFGLFNKGDIEGALSIANEVIKSNPEMPEAYALKGMCNYANRDLNEARQDFGRADDLSVNLKNSSDISSIKLSLSTLELELGNNTEAEEYAREAIDLGLNTYSSFNQLGATLAAQNKFKESIEEFDKAIALNRGDAQLWVNKGSSHFYIGEYEKALECFKEALRINPDFIPALKNLASYYYKEEKEYVLAQELLEKVTKLVPKDVEILVSLAKAYSNAKKNSRARSTLEMAMALEPDNRDVVATLIGILVELADLPSACELTKRILQEPKLESLKIKALRTLEIACSFDKREDVLNWIRDIRNPEDKELEYLLTALLSLNYTNTIPSSDVLRIHQLAGEFLSNRKFQPEYTHDVSTYSANSKLRIGYVSADFCDHSVGYFIKNIIGAHDSDNYEIYCYADLRKADEITDEIRKQSFRFRDITNLNDKKVAELVNNDRIQILVDLGGYTGKFRLPVFAYKPAPIQITYLGYPNTTGLKAMDYRITDELAENMGGTLYSEELLMMPECFLCFGGFPSQNIDLVPAFEKNGFITFGNFNNVGKLTKEGIGVWSQIMNHVNDSMIVFKNGWLGQEITRENILSEFERNGIDRERVRLQQYLDKKVDHLGFYNNIDIALDTFPYNGTTTTCEALWMGVPVVTLVGKKHAQRVSYSILKNIEYDELVAKNEKEYIDIACHLASSPEILKDIKNKIPDNLSQSILCNPGKFTKQLEQLYRGTWSKYVNAQH